MKKHILLAASSIFLLSAGHAHAIDTTVTADLTVDNHYKLFISTNDSTNGALVGESGRGGYPDPAPYDWTDPEHFEFNLTPGVTNYLHVIGSDSTQVIAGFLGTFKLSNNLFKFENGGQTLHTNTLHWRVYTDNFGGTQAPVEISNGCNPGATEIPNGSFPWGYYPEISEDAQWIWTNAGKDLSLNAEGGLLTRYFTTSIVVTPEPISASLFLLGGAALASTRFRRKK